MRAGWLKAYAILEVFHSEEAGQDLVEYAMVMVVIGLAATAAIDMVASQINNVFMTLARKFNTQGN